MKTVSLILLIALCLLASCDDTPPPEPQSAPVTESVATTVLGEKLTNPYSLSVMRQALADLGCCEGGLKSAVAGPNAIEATHLYVRFAPADSSELFDLLADSTLEVFDHPLDREVLAWGDEYHDPELPDTVITYLYCAVPVGMELPHVRCAVLDSLYQPMEPDENPEVGETTLKSALAIPFDDLERRAYELAGVDDGVKSSSRYRPQGYLKYEDSSRGAIEGVQGAKLRFHYFTRVTTSRTNAQGHFYGGKTFRHDPHCEVRWEDDDFMVRPNSGVKVAETHLTGNEKRLFVCRPGTNAWKYASVFRGAYYYYHQWYIGGLTRPPSCKVRRIMIKATDQLAKVGKFYCQVLFGLSSDIRVLVTDRSSAKIFGTTVHELAHAVHHHRDRSSFHHCDDIVKETWTRGVQWYLVTQRYGPTIAASSVQFGRNKYTGLVRDLIDGVFSEKKSAEGKDYYDNVKGFEIKQIEDIIVGGRVHTWEGLRSAVKKKYNGKDSDIDALFSAWVD